MGTSRPEGRRPRPRPHPGAHTASPGRPRQPASRDPTVKKWARCHAHSAPSRSLVSSCSEWARGCTGSTPQQWSQLPGARAGGEPHDGPGRSCTKHPETQQGPDRRPWLSACQGRRQPFWVRNTHSCHKFSNTSSNSIKTYFPGDSDGTESACNAGDLHLIPGLGRSSGQGNGYPL